jgi:putative colanic acid biosynthesis acetyltransferase WcaF
MRLDRYTTGNYTPGASLWRQVLWYFLGEPLFRSHWIPFSSFKVWLLRCFGASVGQQVRIKPSVRVKFPWRLTIGDHVWIGEGAWLDNLAPIILDSQVCVSQNVYLCTGNHDWKDPTFSLLPAAIHVEQDSWLAAGSMVGPGVTVGQGAVLCLGSVANSSLEPMTIYRGNPALPIKKRIIASYSG